MRNGRRRKLIEETPEVQLRENCGMYHTEHSYVPTTIVIWPHFG